MSDDYDQLRIYELYDALDAQTRKIKEATAEIAADIARITGETEVRTLEHWWNLGR